MGVHLKVTENESGRVYTTDDSDGDQDTTTVSLADNYTTIIFYAGKQSDDGYGKLIKTDGGATVYCIESGNLDINFSFTWACNGNVQLMNDDAEKIFKATVHAPNHWKQNDFDLADQWALAFRHSY